MWRHFTALSGTYNEAKLYYTTIGDAGPFSIRLRLTTYRIASETAQLNVVTAIPQIYGNTAGYGTTLLLDGATELPKLQLDGHIDTPFTRLTGGELRSAATPIAGANLSYGDVISTALEGRSLGTTAGRAVHPDYFLDAFGRRFDSPRILVFTAQYIQEVPYRQNFSMTLQLTKGSNS